MDLPCKPVVDRPPMPQVRVDPVLWAAVQRLAARRGMKVAAVMRDALTAYLLASPDTD